MNTALSLVLVAAACFCFGYTLVSLITEFQKARAARRRSHFDTLPTCHLENCDKPAQVACRVILLDTHNGPVWTLCADCHGVLARIGWVTP